MSCFFQLISLTILQLCAASLASVGLVTPGQPVSEEAPGFAGMAALVDIAGLTGAGGDQSLLSSMAKGGAVTNVIMCNNMVSAEELSNDEDYEDIIADIQEECGKAGNLLRVVIPRPKAGVNVVGVGKVFLKYTDVAGAQAGIALLNGRSFSGQVVVASHYNEAAFDREDYSL